MESNESIALASRLMGGTSDRSDYLAALSELDRSTCEALAVGQAQAQRYVAPRIGYASYVYARLCTYAVASVRAAPLSRWVQSDSTCWNFSVLACHVRAILEGFLYFVYFAQPTDDKLDESRARITLLQLNDCCSRLALLKNDPESVKFFTAEAEQLRARLRSIPFFRAMPRQVQSVCLTGKKAWFMDRAQLVDLAGIDKNHFDVWWSLCSQHSHVHPISFFRNEANGRGSGLECDPDRGYLAAGMLLSASLLDRATDQMVEFFPDVGKVRTGLNSKFSPGPKSNLPTQ